MHKLTTAALAGALALSGTLALGTSANAATPAPRPAGGTYATTYLVSRACENEDGSETELCIWDAGRAGNGKGRSVLNVDFGDGYVPIASPKRKVTRANPLRVTIYGRNWSPYSVKVTHGKDTLVRNGLIRWVGW